MPLAMPMLPPRFPLCQGENLFKGPASTRKSENDSHAPEQFPEIAQPHQAVK